MKERRNCTKFMKRGIESKLVVRSNTYRRKCEYSKHSKRRKEVNMFEEESIIKLSENLAG